MDGAGASPLGTATRRVATPANDSLRRGLLGADGRPDQAAVKDAFEALLLGELLKPLQESLTASGLFPAGAQGDIYAHLWQTQLSELMAREIDLLRGWRPGEQGVLPATPAASAPAVRVPTASASARSASVRAAQPAAANTTPPGHLVRSAPSHDDGQRLASRLAPFEPAIQDAARATGVEANWLRAVIIQESSGRPAAVSRKGAAGLMQLMPSTAAALGVRNPLEPAQNIMGGARYLRSLLDRYGDPRLALAAYNAGPGRVETYGGIPPFRETRQYIEGVLALKGIFDRVVSAAAER